MRKLIFIIVMLCFTGVFCARAQRYDRGFDLKSNSFVEKGTWMVGGSVAYSTHNNDKLYEVRQLELVKTEGSHLFFETDYRLDYAGGMKFGLRLYPKNALLPHRMDFALVKWA